MRTKSHKKNKINVVTLGCSKNVYDSEVLMGQLQANEMDVVHETDADDNNIVVINTCGFIDNAKEESVNTILDYVQKKQEGSVEKVFVTGCLSERYKPDLEKEIPDVDQYFGTTELPKLLKALGGCVAITVFFVIMIYPNMAYSGYTSNSSCTGECYEEYVALNGTSVEIEQRKQALANLDEFSDIRSLLENV